MIDDETNNYCSNIIIITKITKSKLTFLFKSYSRCSCNGDKGYTEQVKDMTDETQSHP
jgi:hypothetical protein